MRTFYRLIFTAVVSALGGCAFPNQGTYTLSAAQAEEYRQNTERIEREGDEEENRNLMQQAQATEVATRHAPSSVSNTQIYAPTNF